MHKGILPRVKLISIEHEYSHIVIVLKGPHGMRHFQFCQF